MNRTRSTRAGRRRGARSGFQEESYADRRRNRGFKPSGHDGFEDWVADEISFLEKELREDKVTPKEFHEMRKVISRLVAVFDTMNVMDPSANSRQVTRVLSTLNGRMGSIHDEFIRGKLDGSLDYYDDKIKVPRDVKKLAGDLVELFK